MRKRTFKTTGESKSQAVKFLRPDVTPISKTFLGGGRYRSEEEAYTNTVKRIRLEGITGVSARQMLAMADFYK